MMLAWLVFAGLAAFFLAWFWFWFWRGWQWEEGKLKQVINNTKCLIKGDLSGLQHSFRS